MSSSIFVRATSVGAVVSVGLALSALWMPLTAFAASTPPPAGATIVNNGSAPDQPSLPPECADPAFTTINAAVAAAVAGATIYVCAGMYAEAVVIPTNLTLLGAQFGVSATSGRTDPSVETTIVAPAGHDVTYSGATTGTIDGFSLIGNGLGVGDNNGILAVSGGQTGFTWINNVITGTTTGINFTASGATPTTIRDNRIVGNNEAGGSQDSNGIFFTNGPVNNATIERNVFGSQNADINTTGVGDGITFSTNVVIRNNTSLDSVNFVALFLTTNAVIEDNAAGWSNPNDTNAGSAIGLFGGNSGTVILRNAVSGGAASGIRVVQLFYGPNTAVTIDQNAISNRLNGIKLDGLNDPGSSVTNNAVTDSGVGDTIAPGAGGNGIWVETGSQTRVLNNVIRGSVVTDCLDQTTGSGTAGTASTWTSNIGATSSPAGLCLAAPVPPPPAPPQPQPHPAIGVVGSASLAETGPDSRPGILGGGLLIAGLSFLLATRRQRGNKIAGVRVVRHR